MNIIKTGTCEACGLFFYNNFGHPRWFAENKPHPAKEWFSKNRKLCDSCADEFPETSEEDWEDCPIMETGFGVLGLGDK